MGGAAGRLARFESDLEKEERSSEERFPFVTIGSEANGA